MLLSDLIRQIEAFPDAEVGRNNGLGEDEVANYLKRWSDKHIDLAEVQEAMRWSAWAWNELTTLLKGLVLPPDYAEFLINWGGLEIGDAFETEFSIEVYGIGPFIDRRTADAIMVNFDGELSPEDNAIHRNGMFLFSTWRSKWRPNSPAANRHKQYCIDVRPGQNYGKVFRREFDGQNYSYTLVQPSFSAWLVKLAQTNGELRDFAPEL